MNKVGELQSTIINTSMSSGRADLIKSNFDRLVTEKGREVIFEKSLKCPCKSQSINNLSSCKNCGGTGWIFTNAKTTRMVLQGIEVATKLQGWSEELRGMVKVTAMAEENLSYMDRITAIDGTSFYNEVIQFKLSSDNKIFAYCGYNIKELFYIGLFINATTPLTPLVLNTDYTIINGNTVLLNQGKYGDTPDVTQLSVTLRYSYAPVFHIIEMKRETMQSFIFNDGVGETNQTLPISGYARRAHYQLDAPNLNGDRLLNNDFNEQ